jgi:transcription antitermination factor NusB
MSLAQERRAARERALGLLYEAETKGVAGADVLAQLPVAADDFTVSLVRAVDEHRDHIDGLLTRFAEGWTLARMAALDRAALRMGSAELIARPDVPTGVVLAETVDLASRFSTDASGRFVNGLLARVADEVRGGVGDDSEDDDGASTAPALQPQVDALVIDLDGVIRHWDESYYPEAEVRLGLPAGALTEVALERDRLARAVDGRLPFEGWCEEIGAELAARHGADPEAAAEAWASSTWRIDLAVMDLVAAVREVVPVVLLSNASTRLLFDLETSDILDEFDAAISSADIRAAKPDARAFHAAAEAAGVPIDRCLLVDDTPANVEGARAAGMRGELFTGVEALRALCAELELIP